MKKHIRNCLTFIFIVGCPIFIYFMVVSELGEEQFFAILTSINLSWIYLAGLLMLMYWILEGLVLKITTNFFNQKQKFMLSFKTTMVGQLFNSVTPFASGGQPMQLFYLIKYGTMSPGIASSVLVVKFVVYQTILTIYSLVILLFKFGYFYERFENLALLALIGFTVNSSVIIMLILFTKNKKLAHRLVKFLIRILKRLKMVKDTERLEDRIKGEIKSFHKGYLLIKGNRKMWLKTGILTFFQLTFLYMITYCIQRGLESSGDFIDIISIQSLVQMITSFVPLPGASGAAEGSFVLFFGSFFSGHNIGPAVILWRAITYYSCIILGGLVMVWPSIVGFVKDIANWKK